MGWCFVWACLAMSCGGATRETVEVPGPPHEGHGLYELSIERVRDDCKPPLVQGPIGSVVVVVAGNAANIPLYELADMSVGPARSDVHFDEPLSFDVPIGVPAGCAASEHIEISVPLANAEQIDVRYQRVLAGVSACPPDTEVEDCTSERIFHFRWLRACQDGNITECLKP